MSWGGLEPFINYQEEQEIKMTVKRTEEANRQIGKTLVYGILLAAFYLLAAFNAGTFIGYFTMGNWYAALSIGGVAIFLHAAFAVNLVSALRIRTELHQAEQRAAAAKKRSAQRARPRAYINPWHNI